MDLITELDELSAEKVSGVGSPSNATPWLILKAQMEPPEAPMEASEEAEEEESLMTKAESDEIEATILKALEGNCGDGDCDMCRERIESLPPEIAAKAKLKSKQRRALPDSAFAYIAPNGKRKLPIQDAAHVRNALARFDQTQFASSESKAKAGRKIRARAKELGIEVGASDSAAKMSPGVPAEATATPKEHGHLDSGKSGLAGPATGEVVHHHNDPSFAEGGESSYEVVAEAKANDVVNAPAPPRLNRPAEAVPVVAAKEAGWGIEVTEKQSWLSLEPPAPSEDVDPGSPKWEDYDAASLDSVASGLAGASRAVTAIRNRELVEAVSGRPNDWFDAWKLDCAQDDIASALSLVASLAYHEAAEGTARKVGRSISAKTATALRAARDRLNELLGEGNPTAGNGAKPSEEDDIMATVTKEELAQFIADSSSKAVKNVLDKRDAKARKAAKAKARKNANNGGDISAEQMSGEVKGVHDADDVNSIPDGGKVEGRYANKSKKDKAVKQMIVEVSTLRDLVSKMAERPRRGGPVLDGLPRGGFVAPEGRLTGGAQKSESDVEITKLTKQLEECTDPQTRDQVSRQLTLAKLIQGHMTGEL